MGVTALKTLPAFERPPLRATREALMAAKNSAPANTTPIVRNSAGLRDVIFDEIDAIRNGTSNPTRANAVAKLAMGIVETVRMEIEVHRHLKQSPAVADAATTTSGGLLGSPLNLGG